MLSGRGDCDRAQLVAVTGQNPTLPQRALGRTQRAGHASLAKAACVLPGTKSVVKVEESGEPATSRGEGLG